MSRLPTFPSAHFDEFDEDPHGEDPKRQESGDKMKRLALDLVGRWYWIVLGLVLGYLGASYYLSKAPKQYSATTTLLVKQQTSSVMARDQVDEIDLRTQEAMNTVAERIRRLDLMERVASREDVRSLPGLIPPVVDWRPDWMKEKVDESSATPEQSVVPPPAALGGLISRWTTVSIRRMTRLMDVAVTHPVPEVSKALADAIADEYLKEVAAARTTGRSNSIDLLGKGMDEAREGLQAARGALATYARTLQVQQALDAKEIEVTGLQRKYLRRHPKMITANGELERLKENFLGEFEVARKSPSDRVYWDSVSDTLPDREASPAEYLRTARQLLISRANVLQSETDSLNKVYETMIAQQKEASVNQESEESSTEISSAARVPGFSSAPMARKVHTSGIAGGLAGGLLIALLLVRLDNKYHTVAQIVSDTGETVLAAVSDIRPHHLAAAEKQYLKRHPDAAKNEDFHENWDERIIFRPGVSSTSYAEMYRVLRASVTLLGEEARRKITLFSSALPGEGKTSTSTNYALAAAGQGRKTLLIDLDLRKPSVHKMFGMQREQENGGITECLAGIAPFEKVIIRNTGQENFHLILSGRRAPNPGELLDTGRLKAILARACQEYDVVVLDTAPLLAVPDTRIVAPLAHNVCLVARAEYTPKGAVRRVLDVLREDGTTLSGIVFNGFKEKRRLIGENYSYGYYRTSRYGRAYRYGYGSYGSYGADDEDEKDLPKRGNRRKRR
ncbi:polysaccharide biosynthesis tyrosine autokinase [Luteolibacter flavescens]|uniref:non-specific protein-tyrosine kinase n=1 Tax=Luteolibacter flavescens TaxID=1859460 RepID=A0ABT3FUS7_9BACT|nr:polysaccharide biosynthesis tyrosine autokinase [Luteolibacter flavescens]MCW1887310.1 polysaccharide biosynthesis tyrosine autokinase [Luteolibacter flavescens]